MSYFLEVYEIRLDLMRFLSTDTKLVRALRFFVGFATPLCCLDFLAGPRVHVCGNGLVSLLFSRERVNRVVPPASESEFPTLQHTHMVVHIRVYLTQIRLAVLRAIHPDCPLVSVGCPCGYWRDYTKRM